MRHCPRCDSTDIKGIVYPNGHKYRVIGISEWQCTSCGYREGRWCGNQLQGAEIERADCDGSVSHTQIFDI